MAITAFFGFLLLAQASPGSALERFFVGRTEGAGTVHVIVSGRHGVRDSSRGTIDRSGALLLDQILEEEGKPLRRRSWRLSRTGASGVTSTISNARGAVTGKMDGNTLHLRYRLAEGPSVEQWMTLQPGGRTAQPHDLSPFRTRVATVETVIRKVE